MFTTKEKKLLATFSSDSELFEFVDTIRSASANFATASDLPVPVGSRVQDTMHALGEGASKVGANLKENYWDKRQEIWNGLGNNGQALVQGGLIGAGLGGLYGAFKKKKNKDDSALKEIAKYALIGGGLGAGLGYAGSKFEDYRGDKALDQFKSAIKDRDIASAEAAASTLRKERNADRLSEAVKALAGSKDNGSLAANQTRHMLNNVLETGSAGDPREVNLDEIGGVLGDKTLGKFNKATRDLLKKGGLDAAAEEDIIASAIADASGKGQFNGINPQTGRPFTKAEIAEVKNRLLGTKFMDDKIDDVSSHTFKDVAKQLKGEMRYGRDEPGLIDRFKRFVGLEPERAPIDYDIDQLQKLVRNRDFANLPDDIKKDPALLQYIARRVQS